MSNNHVKHITLVSVLFESISCQGTYEVADTLEVHPTCELTGHVSTFTQILFCFVNKNLSLAHLSLTLLNAEYP